MRRDITIYSALVILLVCAVWSPLVIGFWTEYQPNEENWTLVKNEITGEMEKIPPNNLLGLVIVCFFWGLPLLSFPFLYAWFVVWDVGGQKIGNLLK